MSKLVAPTTEIRPDYGVMAWMAIIHVIAVFGIFSLSWEHFGLMMLMNFLTGCVGITLTYHRLMTHRSFQVPKWLERILATFGVLALQGSPLEWIAHHRMHHAGSDTPTDPHNARQGFYHSHWGWLFIYVPEFDDMKRLKKFGRDIAADPYYQFLDKIWAQVAIQAAAALVLGLIGGIQYIIWGIFVRLVVVYHSTWLVNSASHIWGYSNYEVGDSSKNNWWVALLTWGEGWHNNHHAYGDIAESGHKWWELDVTFMIIKFFRMVGLATNVKTLETALETPKAARTSLKPGVATYK